MAKKSDKNQDKDLTPEFERAVKKLLATKPMPRKKPGRLAVSTRKKKAQK